MVMIELVKGDDSEDYSFQRKNANDEIIKTLPQKMWITFKQDTDDDAEVLIQKTLEDGITFNEETSTYSFYITSEESYSLDYGFYGFDIAIRNERGRKRTLKNDGVLRITDHYTDKENEV